MRLLGAIVTFAFAFALAPASLVACNDHVDISGTYVGEAKVTYVPKNGALVEHKLPNEAVVVKMRMRHYQYADFTITARGCEVESNGGGTTKWLLRSSPCSFDVPTVGPVNVTFEAGGMDRRPDTQSAKAKEIHVSFYGKTEKGDSVSFTIDAKPK